ncbi:MAG: hypothetical protein OEZ38_08835 [Gammaproteobacteria bacterium]|nr:hypothetical protein [Gammaproteobacteria bacterium]
MNHINKYFNLLSQFKSCTASRLPVFLLFYFLSFPCSSGEEPVFLITGLKSEITHVSQYDLRKVYLGGTAADNPHINKPVLNKKDTELYRQFLKNIMHMTDNGYKRKVIKRIFRQGSDKIIEIHNLNELDQHLKDNPNDLSYITESDIKHMLNIRTLKKLW